MAQQPRPVTIHALPEVAQLAHEVNATGKARLVQFGGDIVRLAPVRARRARAGAPPSAEVIEAALAVAGGWKNLINPEEFKRQRRELERDDIPIRTL